LGEQAQFTGGISFLIEGTMSQQVNGTGYSVRAVHCDYRSNDEEVYRALRRATDPLVKTWERLEKAGRIAIKFNQEFTPGKVVMHAGQRQQLVSDPVARATLRLLRDRTRAELVAVDFGISNVPEGSSREEHNTLLPVLKEFDVPFRDGNEEPVLWVPVPGGGQMFQQYPVQQSAAEADEFVSVQKLKNHLFMGVTLCMKNLFGLMPVPPEGRPRTYYHHLVRMPYLLADLGRLFNPALNIIDGIVCQAGEEWGKGENPRICNTLIAGDQVTATDACATHLMGHDPRSDWLTPPFHRDRNHLLIAASSGFGTVDLQQIDFQTEMQAPLGEFFTKKMEAQERIISWRKTTAEQAMAFLDKKKKITDQYAGKYILMQMGEVQWADADGNVGDIRSKLSEAHPGQAVWMKYIDPNETEGEQYAVYEQTLQQFKTLG
jgi:hypothetical protein